MANRIELGIVGIKNMGEYDSQTQYEKLNVVTYQGSTYCALKDTKSNSPTNTEYWQLYAEKGGQGDTGPQGVPGYSPVRGVDYYTQSDVEAIKSNISGDVTTEVSSQLGSLASATPKAVTSVSGMTDTSKIYVLTTNGHWYWYNGSTWVDGGVYQATALNTDKTLTTANEAADAQTCGDFIENLEENLYDKIEQSLEIGSIHTAIGNNTSSDTRARSIDYVKLTNKRYAIILKNNMKVSIRCYSSRATSSYLGYIDWQNSTIVDVVKLVKNAYPNTTQIRFVYSFSDDRTITDVSTILENIIFYNSPEFIKKDDMLKQKINLKRGLINIHDGTIELNGTSTNRLYDYSFIDIDNVESVKISDYKISPRYYDTNKKFITYDYAWIQNTEDILGTIQLAKEQGAKYFNFTLAKIGDSAINDADIPIMEENVDIYFKTIPKEETENKIKLNLIEELKPNFSIRCAKEITFNDGTPPFIDWYLLCDTKGNFYKTKDFNIKEYLFTAKFPHSHFSYSFAIMKNGDIIAIFRTDSLTEQTQSDDVRENPYVFLKSENYTVQHEVEFSSKKPSGWLSNTGFRSLPDGTAVFCEYTRPVVATSNVWKLSGDLLNPSNWEITKTFELSGELQTGFKHCHAIQHDFYTGTLYLATGDDDTGAMIFSSIDNGLSWELVLGPSEKYCRLLNMVFIDNYIYWAGDTGKINMHYLFKVGKTNGVLDPTTLEEVVYLPPVQGQYFATYGISYIKSLDLLVMCERFDQAHEEMPVRVYDLKHNQLLTIGSLYAATNSPTRFGFRTEYTEWYPKDEIIKFGFGNFFQLANGGYPNRIKGFGNPGSTSASANINNLYMKLYKNEQFGFEMGTYS